MRIRNESPSLRRKKHDPDRRHLYFAYGSNTNLDQMAHRCPQSVNMGPAILPGFRLTFRGHADVELDRQYDCVGLLWEVDDYDLESLDIYEGFPHYYLRQRVFVYDHQDQEHVAWVYIMGEQEFESAPSTGYFQSCMTGYEQNRLDTFQLTDAANRVNYNDTPTQEYQQWRKVYSV
jgi:gamma-glutamylcyclotransferase (GGCT)/AIG2-like uncharacterized protein YtfP